MKRLNELFDIDNDMKIYSIHSDSRYVKPYSIFFCIEGLSVDGHRYIDDAIFQGAKVIVHSKDIEKQADCREKIKYASNTLLELVNEVLDMSKLESGEVVLEEVGFNIDQLSDGTVVILEEVAKERNVQIIKEGRSIAHPYLIGSPTHVKRVLMNVLSNAVKYNRDNGFIYISYKELESNKPGYSLFEFTCRDTGIGMSKEFQERIFEPFAQEHIGSRSKSDIIKFVFEFIALLLFIAILKIPVIIIEDAGRWLFERLISPFGDGLGIIWKYAIEIIYLLISVASIVSFVKKKYICDDINENKKVSVKCKNSKRIEKCKTDNTSSNSFSNVLIVLFKVCLILFVVVPAIFSFLVAFVLVIIGIVLLIEKVPYLGIFLCMLTYLILNFLFLDLSFKFIFNKKLNSKALIITIISTVVLFAVGIGLSFYEVVNTTFIDAVPKDIKQLSKEKEELYSDNLSLTCKNIYHTNCEYVIDDTLEDKVVATVTYYDYNNEADDNLNISRTKNADKLKVKNVYKLILSGLRKREFYNFDNINNVILTIKLSTDTKNKIDEKERNESCFGYENCTCDNEGVCSGYNDED